MHQEIEKKFFVFEINASELVSLNCLKIQNLWGIYFVSKYLKFNLNLENAAKIWENVFGFWDNCIWIEIVILSLLRTRYILSAANVLTSSPKIWHVNKRDVF